MSLKHVLLVVLKKQRATGYGITKWFDGPLGYFWKTSHQQVYRALAKLYEDGWVHFDTVPQQGKPDKKVYQVTALGEQMLNQWMLKPLPLPAINEPYLVKLFAADLDYVEPLIAELEQRLQAHKHLHQDYLEVERTYFSEPQQTAQQKMMYLTLKRGLFYEENNIRWANEALSVLREIDELRQKKG
jgi:PadR family transcriptional regulator AphA